MVRTKKRRKIVYEGKNYVWYVIAGDDDYWSRVDTMNYESPFLHIISEDKSLVLTIPLDCPKPYAVSKGRTFQSHKTSGHWERYLLPFNLSKAVTPKFVAEIICWASFKANVTRVKWNGNEIAY